MNGAPHLHLVEGEVPACVRCDRLTVEIQAREDTIAGLESTIRGWTVKYAQLKREKDAEARAHPLWEKGQELFALWRTLCKHPGSRWTPDRFWMVEPFLTKDGAGLCDLAIRGAAFDPYVTRRKNGTSKRHDGWELIFKDRGKFEEFCNRAPRAAA